MKYKQGMIIKNNKSSCYKKVSGTKDSFEKDGRWVSISKVKGGHIVSSMKNGELQILGKSTKKKGAEEIAKKYMGKIC